LSWRKRTWRKKQRHAFLEVSVSVKEFHCEHDFSQELCSGLSNPYLNQYPVRRIMGACSLALCWYTLLSAWKSVHGSLPSAFAAQSSILNYCICEPLILSIALGFATNIYPSPIPHC
jgi:hypothetical protein